MDYAKHWSGTIGRDFRTPVRSDGLDNCTKWYVQIYTIKKRNLKLQNYLQVSEIRVAADVILSKSKNYFAKK